jgi:cytochrome c biogenesis protein
VLLALAAAAAVQVEGLGIVLEDIIGSTGLELKSDPGVPLVYAGFGGLMITTLISYISHSQVGGSSVFAALVFSTVTAC